MIDVTKCKRRDGGEFVIYTTKGKDPDCPIIYEVKNKSGGWFVVQANENGRLYTECESPYDLVEVDPYDHIKPGDLVMVWDNHVDPGMHAIMREFVQEDSTGTALVRSYSSSGIIPWDNCLTVEEYADKYLRKENTDE